MKIQLKQQLLLALFIGLSTNLWAQSNPKLDAGWKMVSENDSSIIVRLEIKSVEINQRLRDGNLVFEFDTNRLSFECKKNIDFFWQEGFAPHDSIYTTLTVLKSNVLSANIHVESMNGIPINSNLFKPVIELKFRKKAHGVNAKIELLMAKSSPVTFENMFNNDLLPFYIGEGWSDPFIFRLE